jgi:hypothetical protein
VDLSVACGIWLGRAGIVVPKLIRRGTPQTNVVPREGNIYRNSANQVDLAAIAAELDDLADQGRVGPTLEGAAGRTYSLSA